MTTLIYSVLLGFLGMDRFCLGHTGNTLCVYKMLDVLCYFMLCYVINSLCYVIKVNSSRRMLPIA